MAYVALYAPKQIIERISGPYETEEDAHEAFGGEVHGVMELETPGSKCSFKPLDFRYLPCTRDTNHDGPCAHPFNARRIDIDVRIK